MMDRQLNERVNGLNGAPAACASVIEFAVLGHCGADSTHCVLTGVFELLRAQGCRGGIPGENESKIFI